MGPGRRGGSEERCTGQAWARDGVARRLAAYGSSGLVEESAQDGDLEERVERHVICARAGGQALVRAGVSASLRLVGSGSEAVSVSPWVGDVFAWLRCRLPSRSFSVVLGSDVSNRAGDHSAMGA